MSLVASNVVTRSESGSKAQEKLHRFGFHAMGTRCEVQFACSDAARAAAYTAEVQRWVLAFEARYSRFRPDSFVGRVNAAAGRSWIEADEESERMLDLCDLIYRLTQQIMDPTLLPLLRLWDYKAPEPKIPADAQIVAARRLVGWRKVQRTPGRVYLPEPGMALDFGGFGKEYAVDAVAQLALAHGITDVLVDFGHDIRTLGRPPGRPAWHIGIEDSRQPGRSDGTVAMKVDCGIASSGDYLRRFTLGGRRFGHIIDPRTGWPVGNGCLQATAIATTCLQAGVLSTTSFILGVPAGIDFIQSFPGAEGLIVTEQLRAQTRGLFHYVVS